VVKPIAKKGLIVVLVVYAVVVAAMVTGFITKARPLHEEEVTARVQQALGEVQAWAHEADPTHIRSQAPTEDEAKAVFNGYLKARGSIISVNYTLLLQCLNFAILLLALYGWLWDPMLKMLDQRRDTVRKHMDDAEGDRRKAAELLEQRHQELGDLRNERTGILEQAESLGEQERREIVARARQEAQRIMEQTEERLKEETRRARDALRDEVADLSARIAAEVLRREISPEDHRRIVREMMEAMAGAEAPGAAPEEN